MTKTYKHIIVLDELAENILQEQIKKRRSKKWFGKFISDCIKKQLYPSPDIVEVYEILNLQRDRDNLDMLIQAKVDRIRDIRVQKELKNREKSNK